MEIYCHLEVNICTGLIGWVFLGKTVVRNYSPGLEKYPRCCWKQTVLPKQVLEKPADQVIPLGIDFYLDHLMYDSTSMQVFVYKKASMSHESDLFLLSYEAGMMPLWDGYAKRFFKYY